MTSNQPQNKATDFVIKSIKSYKRSSGLTLLNLMIILFAAGILGTIAVNILRYYTT